jgi:hypothetical protein
MNVEAIQKEFERCTPEELDRLAASLSVLRLRRDPRHAEELSRRADDSSPGHWLTAEELKKKLDTGK